MSCVRRVPLRVNCGFARVCIYENSNPGRTGRNARRQINSTEREEKFRSQFRAHPNFGIDEDYFQLRDKNNNSPFERDCNKILDYFQKKFRGGRQSKDCYLETFSSLKWSQLPDLEKNFHTYSNCRQCYKQHKECQLSFPQKPFFHPKEPVVSIDVDAIHILGEELFTTAVLSELNTIYQDTYGMSFTDALLKDKSLHFQRRRN